jgi:hypothetical protein
VIFNSYREHRMSLTSVRARHLVTRREFTLQSALALLSGVVITVEGCGGSKSNPTTPTPTGDVSGSISANHGHIAVIAAAAVTAGNAIALDIQGTATHPHTVSVTQADLRSLQSRQAVTKDSTTDAGHQHSVTFTPA